MARRPGAKPAATLPHGKRSAAERADNHAQLVQFFEDAEEVTTDSRKLSERDRDYYDNKQLTSAELRELKRRGQPDVIINRIQTKVNYLLGYEASQRTDPRAFPRTPQDEDSSQACSDALNYVRESTNLAQNFSLAWENMLVEGFAGLEVGVVPDGQGDAEITVTQWDWDRLFYDPHSRKHDYSDARYKGGVIWMDEDDARDRWPDGADVIGRTVSEEDSRAYSDRPQWKTWTQGGKRKRVRIVQMYYLEAGEWKWCIFTKAGKLASGDVPFRDNNGRSICPLIMQSAFVNRDNERYGFVRALIGPQDEINKRRSKSLHLLMGRPVVAETGAVEDVDAAKVEIAKANGWLEVNPGMRFEFADNPAELSGHLGLLQEAKNEIDLLGPNAAMQGKGDRSASGRAIMANQQGGQIEIYRLVDRHAHMKLNTYRLIWAIIRQYWTAHKWIRVTDDEKMARFAQLNRPVTLLDDLVKQSVDEGIEEDQARQIIEQRAQQDPMLAARLQEVTRTENVPADMDMDIILEEVPDSANVQQEQFEILAKLAPAVVFPPDVYIEMSALRNKKKLLEKLDKLKAPDPAKQQAAELEMATMATELEKLKAEIDKIRADTVQSYAKADSLDQQFGQVIKPQIIDASAQMMPQGPGMMPGMPMGHQGPMPPQMIGGQGLPPGPPPMPMGGPPMAEPPMPEPPPQIDPGLLALSQQGFSVEGGYPQPIDPTAMPIPPPSFTPTAPPQFSRL